MTKTLNQIIFFSLHHNQNIFFSNIGNQNIFLEKNHNPPFKLNGPSLTLYDHLFNSNISDTDDVLSLNNSKFGDYRQVELEIMGTVGDYRYVEHEIMDTVGDYRYVELEIMDRYS